MSKGIAALTRSVGWVDLLFTDSLERPLGSAPYVLDHGGASPDHGRLTAEGRLEFAWPGTEDGWDPEVRLLICHRTLILSRGATSGLAWDRNRLTNLGFDAGPPTAPPDPDRVAHALDAFARHAGGAASTAADALRLLDGWYLGELGLEPVLRVAANRAATSPGFLRRWLAKRREMRVQETRSGSHLAEAQEGGRAVAIALGVGPEGSHEARNRLVVFDWFSGYGTPPRAGNMVLSLIDGEQTWATVADDIDHAREELCISTWFADPDTELRRPLDWAIANSDQRARFRLATLVERLAKRGGTTAMLLWNWVGTPLWHPTLRRWALTPDDRVEVLQYPHPSLLGSFHEKLIVVDRKVAYCGGFNLRQNDWDTQEHRVDDARRNPHALQGWDRRTSEPAYPPRHDMALRLEGPIVADVHEHFTRQWNGTLRRERRLLTRWLGRLLAPLFGSGPASPIVPLHAVPPPRGGMVAQLVRTDPSRRARQQAIADVIVRAIHNAREIIYIENQFFRSMRVAEALVAAIRKRPRLEVIVVTNEIGPPMLWLNPLAYWTRKAQDTIRAERPDFRLHELNACGMLDGAVAYRPVFIHSKVMVVDDEWATVGSANINDRSIYTEYEVNVAVEDEAFAAGLRRRLMAEHLGLPADDPRLREPAEAATLWRFLAEENAAARAAHRIAPGRAHPFLQQGGLQLLRGRPEWF